MLRARDEVQGWDLRPQRDSDMRGEVLLYFLVCTGEYIYNVKLKNEKLTTDKFCHLSKGPETHMKIQHPKLPYLACNTCSAIAWPSQYLWIARLWSDMLMWPHYFDIPTCWCPQQLFYWTIKLLQCCTVPNWGLQWAWDVGQKQKSSEIAKTKSPEMIGNGWKWLGKVMWPQWHVAQSCDHPLMVQKCENTCIVGYGAHHCILKPDFSCWKLSDWDVWWVSWMSPYCNTWLPKISPWQRQDYLSNLDLFWSHHIYNLYVMICICPGTIFQCEFNGGVYFHTRLTNFGNFLISHMCIWFIHCFSTWIQ